MVEVVCNIAVLTLLARLLWQQQKTLKTLTRETREKYEVIYYMLCDVLREHQENKKKGD